MISMHMAGVCMHLCDDETDRCMDFYSCPIKESAE
jgi:hypothetical protein